MLLFFFFAFAYSKANRRQNHMKQQPYTQRQSYPFQKVTFHITKGGILHGKRPPFVNRKVAFCIPYYIIRISRAAKMATRLMRICYLMCQFFTFKTQTETHKMLWHKTLGGLRRCDRKARGAYLLSFAETDTTSGARSTRLKYTSMFSAANLLLNSFSLVATLLTDWSLGMMVIRQAPFKTYSSLSNVMPSFLAYLISMCASNGSSSTSTSFFYGIDVTASVCSLPLPST